VGAAFAARLTAQGGGNVAPTSSSQDPDGHFTFQYDNLTTGTRYGFAVSFNNFATIDDSVSFTA
jgi:hypothetical protein